MNDQLFSGGQAPQGGGLLGMMAGGGMPQQSQSAPQASQQGIQQQSLQLAMQLSQSPTPQMAQQVVMKLKQIGSPAAQQMEQVLGQANGNPEMLKQIADAAIQQLGGANA